MSDIVHKKTPPRLERVFQSYDAPIFFITFNAWQRARILDRASVHAAFLDYARRNAEQGRCVGGYVIMPDHVHAFVRLNREARLNDFVRLLKQHLGKTLTAEGLALPHWQPGFFDHLLRSHESYAEKWHYVGQNPVRAGLVTAAEDWPYRGEVTRLEF